MNSSSTTVTLDHLVNIPIGLLINLNEVRFVDGVHCMILPQSNFP